MRNLYLLAFLLGVAVGLLLAGDRETRRRYAAVRRAEPTGPADFGIDLESL